MSPRITPEALYRLLPALHRLRDADEGEPLRQFIEVLAREGAVVEESIAQLLDNLFIETCQDWAAPYIGGSVGYRALHPVAGLSVGNRAEVANTIGYRRRKGTAAMLEQLARDVSGWPARVVEYFQHVATCQHMNHIRPDHAVAPDLRDPLRMQGLGGAFDAVTRSVDVRAIQQRPSRQSVGGRHNLPNIGIHLWRLETMARTDVPATRIGPRRFLFDPLGAPRQLVNPPLAEDSVTTLAAPVNVPVPITRRLLAADPAQWYPRAFQIFVDGSPVPVDQIEACDLSDSGAGWNHAPHQNPAGGDVRVDPELGRIAFRQADPGAVRVSFHTAFTAPIGGGEYNRAADLRSEPGLELRRITDPATDLDAELAVLRANGGILELAANEVFAAPSLIAADAGRQVILRAADECHPILRASAPVLVMGGADAGITLDGCLIAGERVQVMPDGDGAMLKRLTLRHVTLLPGHGLTASGAPLTPNALSLDLRAEGVELLIDRSISGPVEMHQTTELELRDSMIDAAFANPQDSAEGMALSGPGGFGGAMTIVASTVIGRIAARSFPLVSDSILWARSPDGSAPVRAMRRQQGCMRFSYIPPGAITPRRYRCQPQLAAEQAVAAREAETGTPLTAAERAQILTRMARRIRPVFTSQRFADPAYLQPWQWGAQAILRGASDEGEMGATHQLYHAQRETNLRIRIEEYLRFALEAGLIFET